MTPGAFRALELLSLADNKLTGTLPATWRAFGALDLSINPINGSLPEVWVQSPASASMQYLNVAGTGLSGNLPPDVSTLTFPGLPRSTVRGPVCNFLC